MKFSPSHSNALLLLFFLITFPEISSKNGNHFPADVSINCGSTGTSSARSGRTWLGDHKQSKSLLQLKGSSTISTPIRCSTSIDPVPHNIARISSSPFSYAFHVNLGQKIIRLHFNPTEYKGFRGFQDLFTVKSGSFTLLSNFSSSLTANALSVNALTKEFCLNVLENQPLNLFFTPQSENTYAFINGIEIISVPVRLSYFHGGDVGLQVIGKEYVDVVSVDSNTVLEIIYRLNIKQDCVPSNEDIDGLFPKWATQKEEKNKSRTWRVPVDVGFRYLVRLHFSELGLKIAGLGEVMFEVSINGMTALTNGDVMKASDGDYVLLYRDYMVMMRGGKEDGKRNLLISLQSYDELRDEHGVLAGFEVVKMSNHDNSLASPNPQPPPQGSPSLTARISFSILVNRNTNLTLALIVISVLNTIVYKLREMWKASNSYEEIKVSARAERFCRRFSLAEIQLATRNFSDGLIIGRCGFGLVYKGLINKGQKTVAVKRSKSTSTQGEVSF